LPPPVRRYAYGRKAKADIGECFTFHSERRLHQALGYRASVAPDARARRALAASLTLHEPDGERLIGFDNAHPVARQKQGGRQDHRHRLRTIRAYEYRDGATLLADFWEAVDAVLRERGVIP